ncbi:MAG: DNA polymerase III subunit gamma/tau, partial [Planctomycetota bacterium]|nr:DNA polymerase III subunit gamma/tau [Planctomycetota bacterium]
LRNAIGGDRVAHAYLFTGARGVGKTSMARILAKALNCPNSKNAVPCNECEVCTGISRGNDVDVMEIDGASNNGVEDIRTLRSNVNVKSMRTQFKLYIIDEVHMLSKGAFNALLKTLEEPPPNVKFVFCTTEPNKLPDTILSRCQRFDFTTIETSNIVERLHQIAVAEGYTVEPAALELVARRAAGSMRDSQSLFDQLLAFGEELITSRDVHRLLGTASDDRLIEFGAALISRNRATVLELFDRALADGVQLGEFMGQLIEYCRDLMLIAAGAESVGLLSVAATSREALSPQAKQWGLETIVAAMEILAEARGRMSRVTFGRAVAELALIRVSLLQDLSRIDELVQALNAGAINTLAPQKKSLANPDVPIGNANATARQAAATPVSAETLRQPPTPIREPIAEGLRQPAPQESVASPVSPHIEPQTSTSQDSRPNPQTATSVPVVNTDHAPPSHSIPTSSAADSTTPAVTRHDLGPTSRSESEVSSERAAPQSPGAQANSVPVLAAESQTTTVNAPLEGSTSAPEPTPQPTILVPLEVGRESEFLAQLVDGIEDMTQTHVRGASKLAISGPNGLELSFTKSYHFSKTYCERPEVKLQLESVASKIAGQDVRISLKLIADQEGVKPQPVPQVSSKRVKYPDHDEFVQQAMSVFDATIVKVEGISGPVLSEDMNP